MGKFIKLDLCYKLWTLIRGWTKREMLKNTVKNLKIWQKWALLFSGTYLILSVYGVLIREALWRDPMIFLSCVLLGLVVTGSFLIKSRLLDLHEEIKQAVANPEIIEEWQESLLFTGNKKLPFAIGVVLSVFFLFAHYFLYGVMFQQEIYYIIKYNTMTYWMATVLTWSPVIIFGMYICWLCLIQYFWIFGKNPKEHPLKLGRVPPKILKRMFPLESSELLQLKEEPKIIDEHVFRPLVDLILASIKISAMSVFILICLAFLAPAPSFLMKICFAISLSLIILFCFFYPLSKIYNGLKWIKTEKIKKIETLLDEKIDKLERLILSFEHDVEELKKIKDG